MTNKILAAYSTRAGSTAGVAEVIGKTLTECGAKVEVRPMNDVEELTPCRAEVAGTPYKTSNGCLRPCNS